MEENKIIETVTKSVTNRLKIPIIVTYLSVLIIYNWDILFYLFFENIPASLKIQKIQSTYGDVYVNRIMSCLMISIGLIILFTILNTSLNFGLKWFYRKDKEISSEIEDYENITVLTEQLSNSIEKTKKLELEIKNLRNINQDLNSQKIDLKISEISERDYEKLMKELRSSPNSDKLLFSFKELFDIVKRNQQTKKLTGTKNVIKDATYSKTMESLLGILKKRNLIDDNEYDYADDVYQPIIEIGPSFKDFLELEV